MRKREWIEDLGRVLDSAIQVENILRLTRNDLQVNAQKLFEEIDEYQIGYVSSRVLKLWI
jgi:hypothetical protein